jgi:hypothetical protein
MNFQDLANNIATRPGWAGATINTNTDTVSTVVIDTQGFESVAFAVYSGTYTDGTYVLKIMECDNSDGTTGATEVPAYQVQQQFGAAGSNLVKKVGADTTKRYCTLKITSTGTTTGCVFKGAVALLGGARNSPVA